MYEKSNELVKEMKIRFEAFRKDAPDLNHDQYKSRPPHSFLYNFTRTQFCKRLYTNCYHYRLETFKEIVKAFINAGLNLYDTANNYHSYLSRLVFYGDLDRSKILVENGANINRQDELGYTLLHHASYMNHEKVAKWLITIGADINIKSEEGKTALDMAREYNHSNIINLLTNNLSYPFFLQHFKVKSNQLTPVKVANALWLLDKDAKTTKISKLNLVCGPKSKSLTLIKKI